MNMTCTNPNHSARTCDCVLVTSFQPAKPAGIKALEDKLRADLRSLAEEIYEKNDALRKENEELKSSHLKLLKEFERQFGLVAIGTVDDEIHFKKILTWSPNVVEEPSKPVVTNRLDAICNSSGPKLDPNSCGAEFGRAATSNQPSDTSPSRRSVSVGDIVFYVPPQDCKGSTTLERYAAVVTQVNETWDPNAAPRDCGKKTETVELCTFGPNSVYFQHAVPFSEVPAPGTWTFRD